MKASGVWEAPWGPSEKAGEPERREKAKPWHWGHGHLSSSGVPREAEVAVASTQT